METKQRKPQVRELNTSSDTSSAKPTLSDPRNMITKEPEFKHSVRLLLVLAPSACILFSFGGRPSLVALCFGCFVGYILDLAGAFEGAIASVVVTSIAIWGTIMWAARFLLIESLLNFVFVFVLGFILIYHVFVLASGFKSLRLEFESAFYCIETVMFCTLPLISASILTWFLCVEFSAVDLPTCFSSCYFIFLVFLAAPMKSSLSAFITPGSGKEGDQSLVLTEENVVIMYIVPLVFSPVLYVVVHQHVLRADFENMVSFIESFMFPLLLVTIAGEGQLEYWPVSARGVLKEQLGHLKLLLSLLLACCIQRHPLFDDLKGFSGMSTMHSSLTMCLCTSLGFVAILLHKVRHCIDGSVVRVLINASIAFSSIMLSVLLDMGLVGTAITMIGTLCIAEFYGTSVIEEQVVWKAKGVTKELLVIVACVSTVIVLHTFIDKTLLSLNFTFLWYGTHYTVRDFCFLETFIAAVAIASPPLVTSQQVDQTLGYVSGAMKYDSPNNKVIADIKCWLFFLAFQFMSVSLAVVELLIRENDWDDHGVKTGAVYPSYLLVLTSSILLMTCHHLVSSNLLSRPAASFVAITQLSKLIHLLGFRSDLVISFSLLLLSYMLPFIFHYDNIPMSIDPSETDAPSLKYVTSKFLSPLYGYCLLAAFGTYYACKHCFPLALSTALSKNVSDLQVICLSVSILLLQISAMLTVFWNRSTFLRTCLLLTSAFFLLIAAEALGPLSITVDPTSTTYLIVGLHPELAQGDHSGLFLLVTAMLVVTAFLGLLPIHRPVPRMLFAVSFSYCTAHAVLGIAFPASMGMDSPHNGMFELPWVYSYAFSVMSTSTALRAIAALVTKKRDRGKYESISKNYIFLVWSVLPLLALLWAAVEGSLKEHALGIMWVACLQFGLTAVTIRLRNLHLEYISNSTAAASTDSIGDVQIDATIPSICSFAALFAFSWGLLASVLSPHVASDISVPLLSLLLLLTSSNVICADLPRIKLSCFVSGVWWVLSAFYATSIKGMMNDAEYFDAFHLGSKGIAGGLFGDHIVSFWLSTSIWIPCLNFILVFIPIPSILLSVFPSKDTAEDTIFVLSILSALAIIGAGIWSIRLLGLLGLVLGSHRCNEIGNMMRLSNRAI